MDDTPQLADGERIEYAQVSPEEWDRIADVPEIYALWGEPLLGPWSQLDDELRVAWTQLDQDLHRDRRLVE